MGCSLRFMWVGGLLGALAFLSACGDSTSGVASLVPEPEMTPEPEMPEPEMSDVEPEGQPPEDECEGEGQTRCAGEGGVETCVMDDGGRLVWSPGSCGEGQRCEEVGAEAVCVCADDCEVGETTCSETEALSCVRGPEGCAFFEARPATLSGTVSYERRPISSNGLGPVGLDTLEGATLVVLSGEREVARGLTDEAGRFCFVDDLAGQEVSLRVLAQDDQGGLVEVVDFSEAVHSVRTMPFVAGQGSADIQIAQSENAGSFAILDTLRVGLDFARVNFGRSEPWPTLLVRWERGNSTPGGSSYFDRGLWILGGPRDTDEYDVPVLLHELGHYLQFVYGLTDPGSGFPHDGQNTDPRQAWGEGWASLFASVARGSSEYLDSFDDDLGLYMDLASLPPSGEFAGRPERGLDQTLSEWLIAASMWRMHVSGDPETQSLRMMAVLRDWFDPLVTDRGRSGADFVDYLDGYLCLHEGADRAVIEDHIVQERRFPYDFAGTCPMFKPGRPRLNVSLDISARPEPPGQIVFDAAGRRLREVRVSLK